MHKILNALADYELLFRVDICDEDHNREKYKESLSGDQGKIIIWQEKIQQKKKTSNIQLNFVNVTCFSLSIDF